MRGASSKEQTSYIFETNTIGATDEDIKVEDIIILGKLKMFYYRGLDQWELTQGYLIDTCLTAQDQYKALLDYFRIKY